MRKVSAVVSQTHSKDWDTRYVIVDDETGEVLDDAQGYGYKSARGAYAAWAYKNRDKSKDKAKAQRYAYIRKWLKEHKEFKETMDRFALEILKGSWGPDDKFDAAFVAKMLKDFDLTPDFSAGELLRVWSKE